MKLKRRKIKRGRIEIIPMIDTIVILLIFYMSFARFSQMSKEANIVLPLSKAGRELVSSPNTVILNMFNKDDVRIGGDRYNMDQLANVLRALKTAEQPKDRIVLRGDRKMTYTDLSELMRACAKAGIVDVTFTTLEER